MRYIIRFSPGFVKSAGVVVGNNAMMGVLVDHFSSDADADQISRLDNKLFLPRLAWLGGSCGSTEIRATIISVFGTYLTLGNEATANNELIQTGSLFELPLSTRQVKKAGTR
jgi:hypothetical protein